MAPYTSNVYPAGMRATIAPVAKKRGSKASSGRTNIVIDPRLVARVKRLARVKTAREAVNVALEHYARSRDYSRVLALRGSGGVGQGYDPKAANPRRM